MRNKSIQQTVFDGVREETLPSTIVGITQGPRSLNRSCSSALKSAGEGGICNDINMRRLTFLPCSKIEEKEEEDEHRHLG